MSHQEKQRIFDEYAKSNGFDCWKGLQSTCDPIILKRHIFRACDKVQEEQQKRIAGNSLVRYDYINLNKTGASLSQSVFAGPGMRQYTIDKESIINPENKIQ